MYTVRGAVIGLMFKIRCSLQTELIVDPESNFSQVWRMTDITLGWARLSCIPWTFNSFGQ